MVCATILDLPTEIICVIFELVMEQWEDVLPPPSQYPPAARSSSSSTSLDLALSSLSLSSSPSPSPAPSHSRPTSRSTLQLRPLSPPTLPPHAAQYLCSLPPLKSLTRQCLTLSHIHPRLRAIAIDMQSLWSSIRFTRSAFSLGHTTPTHLPPNQNKELTAAFLSRSNDMPLFLEVNIDTPYIDIGTSLSASFQDNVLREVLKDHVHRVHALRLACNDLIITDIFDVFLEYNSNFNVLTPNTHHPSPLSHIHVVQTSTALHKRTFPSDLSLIAPNLEYLRAECTQISAYPRWRLRDVVLEDTRISYRNIFQIFIQCPSNTVVFHRLKVPGGRPYIRRLSDPRQSPVACVVFSELRCHGEREEQREVYELFFTLTLFPTLQELVLSSLDTAAMASFVSVLRPTPPLVFRDLRKLTLRKVSMNSRSLVQAMVTSFPGVREMILEDVSPHGLLVLDVWRNGVEHGIWLELRQVRMDGTVLSRESA